MIDFLPKKIKNALANVNLQKVYELRLRANKPTTVNYNGVFQFLGEYGVVENKKLAIVCDETDIADCVFRAGNYSIYSVEEQLKKGFLSTKGGVRIGLAGEYVFEKGQPLALRNFSSLCIRMPHEVLGCGEAIYHECMSDIIRNMLLMSSPGLGKTTILRDLGRLLGMHTKKNILVCDERGEISMGNIGDFCDVLKFCDKKNGFEAGIRTMRPDIIITDELSQEDCVFVKKAISCGIKVLASAHFSSMEYVNVPFFPLFDRYVLLKENAIGQLSHIYDERGAQIY